MKIKNILLIGKTGNGKSTIANVLTQSDLFTESSGSTSQTRIIQAEQFNHDNQQYSIIDTPGFFDTKLAQEQILDIISEAVYLVKDGLSQVFFVSKGRFDHYEMATYNILREIIFDKDISEYTTLVRTNFDRFNEQSECESDLASMKSQEDFKEIIESCSLRLIHVNNPSLKAPRREKNNRKKRELSREKLLEHLRSFSLEDYKPTKLQSLSNEISYLITEKKEFEEKLRKLEAKRKDSSFLNTEQSLLIDQFGESSKANDSQYVSTIRGVRSKFSTSQFRNLESEKELLERKVIEKQVKIRNKVLSHILHNADRINELSLGKEFLAVMTDDGYDWTTIDPNFTLLEKAKWIEKGFKHAEVLEWRNALGDEFKVTDYGFCHWLELQRIQSFKLEDHNLAELRADYVKWLESDIANLEAIVEDWTMIDWRFSEIPLSRTDGTYQQDWEDYNLTYQDAKDWLVSGFIVEDYEEISEWKRFNFTAMMVEELLGKGFGYDDYQLAAYARTKGYLNDDFNYSQLREEYEQWLGKEKDVIEYLEAVYPLAIRKNVRELSVGPNITGQITITAAQWNSLEKVFAYGNKLSSLTIIDCEKLDVIASFRSELTNFTSINCANLTSLNLSHNQLANNLSTFSSLVKLKILHLDNNDLTGDLAVLQDLIQLQSLDLANNPQLTGSLQSLRAMSKLKYLNLRNTNVQVMLAMRQSYLPTEMELFECNEFKEEKGTMTYH